LGFAGDHVDHGEEGVGAVERRTGATDDLDALDHVDIDEKFGAEVGLAENVVIDAVAVDEDEQAIVGIAEAAKAAYADETVVAIVGDVEAADGFENVGERAIAVFLYFVGGDYRDGGWGVAGVLHALGGGVDGDVHKVFEVELGEVAGWRRVGLLLRRDRKSDERRCDQSDEKTRGKITVASLPRLGSIGAD
jgi:hypothetical protein